MSVSGKLHLTTGEAESVFLLEAPRFTIGDALRAKEEADSADAEEEDEATDAQDEAASADSEDEAEVPVVEIEEESSTE